MTFSSQVVAGGSPGDFCLVRHVRLQGDQREIGRDVAEIAWSDHQVRPGESAEPALTRARYPSAGDLPPGDGPALTYGRFRTLTSLLCDQAEYSPEEIIERHAAVRFTQADLPVRTLWYALYDPQAKSMRVSFHLRNTGDGELRTPIQEFWLREAAAVA